MFRFKAVCMYPSAEDFTVKGSFPSIYLKIIYYIYVLATQRAPLKNKIIDLCIFLKHFYAGES